MKCRICGAVVNGDNRFCGTCGTKVRADSFAPNSGKCSQCGGALNPDMKFCVSRNSVNGGPRPLSPFPTWPARRPPNDSQVVGRFSCQPEETAYPFAPAPGTGSARQVDPLELANQAARQIKEQSSSGQKISLSAASFGILCFFLPWVEVSCIGVRRTASGLELASDVGLSEIWLVLLAMLAVAGMAVFQILSRTGRDPLSGLLSLATIGAGILPLVVCLFEWMRFSNEVMNMKGSDPYGFGRLMGNAIQNSVSYEVGSIFTIMCSLGVTIGGLLHLMYLRKQTGGT